MTRPFSFVLGALESLAPRTLDGAMGGSLGPAYARGTDQRVRPSRPDGLPILVLGALICFASGGCS